MNGPRCDAERAKMLFERSRLSRFEGHDFATVLLARKCKEVA